MKILYICRLYSGFEESLQTGRWNPKGAPTIAKMIEALDGSDFEILLTQKTFNDPVFPKRIKMDGLKTPITVLPGSSALPAWLWKFRDKISDLKQLWTIIHAVRKSKPDLVFCDRVNILPAAILARFLGVRVIWRVMGVLGIMHRAAKENSIRAHFLRWLWRSPFKTVICTRDGSDGEPWLKAMLQPDIPYHMLLNGIDMDSQPEPVELPQGKKVLFVGRLEPMKGTYEFLKAVADVPKLQAIIAGDGSLMNDMHRQADDLGIKERVHFLGSQSAAQLKYIRQNCDFYVSLNTHGNLTNVNLEALSDHLPTIIPSSSGQIDSDTDALIPENVFYRFGRVGDTKALVEAMHFMAKDKNLKAYRRAAKQYADTFLPSWPERVSQELEIYKDCMPYDLAIMIADLGSGGAQKVVMALVNELAAQGQRIAVITLSDGSDDFHVLPKTVKRITLEQCNLHKGLQANIGRVFGLRRALKQIGARNAVSFIGPTNVLAVWACMGLKTRLTISERNDPARQSFGRLWNILRILSYRFADNVTANSHNALETMKAYVPAYKLKYVPNALSPPPKQTNHADKTVLIVGTLRAQKNHALLLEAFAQTRNSHPDWKLVIAGDGPLLEDLKALAKKMKIAKAVHFKGKVKNPYALYAKASIFALPSLHEGTPNALLEAMSCGVAPIISDACEGALPFITNGKSGLVVPVNDVDALAKALMKLMAAPKRIEAIGAAAQKKVAPLYKRTTAEIWQDVLEAKK